MKFKLVSVLMIAMMLVATLGVGSASASGYTTSWKTMVAYMNIGTGATTTLNLMFYESKDDTTPTTVAQGNINQYGSLAVEVGTLGGLPADFQGTAVMVADQPLAATLVQIPDSTSVNVHPLSNGFKAGAGQSLIGTILKGNTNSKFVVQNTGTAAATVDIKIYNTANPPAVVYSELGVTIEGGAGYYLDSGTMAALGASFSGSAVVTSADGTIIASVLELSTTNANSRAFEGVAAGAKDIYLPTAVCKYSGQTSNFAVQNASLASSTQVTMRYSNGKTQTVSIGPGAKASINTCTKQAAGWSGSAKATSATTDIIVIGKNGGGGASTAYNGFATGSAKVALPFALYGNTTQYNNGSMPHVNIAIQNIGTTSIPGGTITVKYYDPTGALLGTHTLTGALASLAKGNSNASQAGLTTFGCLNADCSQVGGTAVIEGPAGSQLAVVARATYYKSSSGLKGSEDYNGIPIE